MKFENFGLKHDSSESSSLKHCLEKLKEGKSLGKYWKATRKRRKLNLRKE
jgi:hypothetical protein